MRGNVQGKPILTRWPTIANKFEHRMSDRLQLVAARQAEASHRTGHSQ